MPSSSTRELNIRPVRRDNKVKGKVKAKAKEHSERLSVIKQLNLATKRERKRRREWERESKSARGLTQLNVEQGLA